MEYMCYIGLDVHKRTISYCVKDRSGTLADAPRSAVWYVGLGMPLVLVSTSLTRQRKNFCGKERTTILPGSAAFSIESSCS